MKKPALLFVALALTLTVMPASGSASPIADDTPYGREDNALGTLRWLPRNAIEKPAANQFRLVVVYDGSLNDAGQPIPMKAKGAFGVKIFTTSVLDLKMKGHSAKVSDLRQFTGQSGIPPQVDESFAGLAGDVRDGACSKLSTPGAFSQAYSTSRQFFFPGTTPYQPISAPGTCETVDASVEVRDANGNLTGFNTTVTNHVPGFYVDFEWPTRPLPQLGGSRFLAEVWYGGAYDSSGDPGPFPNGVDASGASKSVGSPGDYDATYSFTANPGGAGPACTDWGVPDQAGTWADVTVNVPAAAKKVTFKLFPKGDWDIIVLDPDGTKGIAGNWMGSDEQLVVPASGANNIPELIPGNFTFRGCNFSGEQTVMGAVIIEY